MKYQDLDLVILKTITSNTKYLNEFVYENNEKLFLPDLWRFARLVIDYAKIYKNTPTQRIMVEQNVKNETLVEYINTVWEKLNKVEYNIKEYPFDLERLKKRFAEKLIFSLKEKIRDDQELDVKKAYTEINSVAQNIRNLNQPKTYEQGTLKDTIADFRNNYKARLQDPFFGQGIMTGYSSIDYILNGLRKQEMVLVCSETGGGKSLMLSNLGINMYFNGNSIDKPDNFKPGNDILYFSLEMPFNDMRERILSRMAMVPQKLIRDAKMEAQHNEQMGKTLRFIEKYPSEFEIVDAPRGLTVSGIETIFNDITIKRGKKPDVVIVDYLNLLSSEEEHDSDWLSQIAIAQKLHEFGRANDVLVLSAIQLNVVNKSQDKDVNIGIQRIGRSKGIANEANIVIQIEKRSQEALLPDLSVHIIKSRRSELFSAKLFKNPTCCAILDSAQELIGQDQDISKLIDGA